MKKADERRCIGSFGVSPTLCSILWNKVELVKEGVFPSHLLWSLLFLKIDDTQDFLCSITGSDEKTLRKWAWYFVKEIASLEAQVVSISIVFVFLYSLELIYFYFFLFCY